ncbi:MAG TPA: SDR family NAD(P)-dependent oxidoreductase [Polyangiaceae bacterium]|nr:SDR family NAD(P)-dependent oxidoreductase [Polyangiaceae bacterium]
MSVAVVTGANRGLGLATAQSLAGRGYRVWLTGRDAASAEAAASQLRARNLDVQAALLDVSDASTVSTFAERMASEPPIAALINNAGASFEGFGVEVATRTLDGNYRGAVRVTDALFSRLDQDANIVMVSSGMGELGNFSRALRERLLRPDLSRAQLEEIAADFVQAVARGTHQAAGFPSNAYSVSKALLNGFTRVLARELEGSSRRVNAVCPGWVRTRMGGSSAARSVEQGASGILWAATLSRDGNAPQGGFFRDGKAIPW